MQQSVDAWLNNDLVHGIQQGNAAAETALYEKFASRIYFLAVSELRSKDDAEDIRAETFLRVIVALRAGKLRSADSLPSFIVGFALNVIREYRRHKSRTDSLEDHDYDVASEGLIGGRVSGCRDEPGDGGGDQKAEAARAGVFAAVLL